MSLDKLNEVLKGGAGSGFHGHSGVKGKRGGSAPGKGSGGMASFDSSTVAKLQSSGYAKDSMSDYAAYTKVGSAGKSATFLDAGGGSMTYTLNDKYDLSIRQVNDVKASQLDSLMKEADAYLAKGGRVPK